MANLSKIVPTISSGTAGPLGVLHLPRMWQKITLGVAGLLPEDYDMCGQGYDQMVIDALGLNREEVIAYFKAQKPGYIEFEKWIIQKKGGSVDAAAVKKLNDGVAGYIHADNVRTSILGAAGISDEGKIKDAVNLNNIDDWTSFHSTVTK
ncbi:MAG: DUF5069 domain-containing protein [Verrucomicrobiota bacterium]|nr:DUF5069 domain-containing protein [Verrucomicrobiota bacterium]